MTEILATLAAAGVLYLVGYLRGHRRASVYYAGRRVVTITPAYPTADVLAGEAFERLDDRRRNPVQTAIDDAYRAAEGCQVGSDDWLRWIGEVSRLERNRAAGELTP